MTTDRRPTPDAPDAAEEFLVGLSEALTAPGPGECVLCFAARMVSEFGCDTTMRWVRRWRDLRVQRATGLVRRLNARGGFCDCEIFLNGITYAPHLLVRSLPPDPDEDEDVHEDEGRWPNPRPRCGGVRSGSTKGCTHWVRHRRR